MSREMMSRDDCIEREKQKMVSVNFRTQKSSYKVFCSNSSSSYNYNNSKL